MCGRREAKYRIEIEGAELDVCEVCAKHGKVIRRLRHEPQVVQPEVQVGKPSIIEEEELVSDYAERIRKACSKLGITYRTLAERINEKESYVEKIFYGRTRPDEKTARKIQHELHIQLFEKTETTVGTDSPVRFNLSGKDKEITLGDIVQFEKK